jgi:CheY-like chemotaxis protein
MVLELSSGKRLPTKIGSSDLERIVSSIVRFINNAIEPSGGTIRICVAAQDDDKADEIRISTSAALRASIAGTIAADPNSVLEPTSANSADGDELDPWIAYVLLSRREGTITVNATGATTLGFNIVVPLKRDKEELHKLFGGDGKTVLLVDDDRDSLRVCAAALGRVGYQTIAMVDSEEALVILKRESAKVDMIIADLTMPLMRGDELLAKALEIRPSVKVLLFSGFDDQSHETPFLHKPCTMFQLLKKVREVLES